MSTRRSRSRWSSTRALETRRRRARRDDPASRCPRTRRPPRRGPHREPGSTVRRTGRRGDQPPTGSTLRNRVPGFDVADLLHAELPCARSLAHPSTGGEHECDVVARVDALDDRAGEPVTAGENRTSVGARTPFDARELVDFVTGQGTEEARQVLITLAEEVDDEGRRRQRDAVRPVLLRQPDPEARGLDTALRRKTDQAPVALVSGCSCHHVRRTVELGDDGIEGFCFRAHAGGWKPFPGWQ